MCSFLWYNTQEWYKLLRKYTLSLTLSCSKVQDDVSVIVNTGIIRDSDTQFEWSCWLDCFKWTWTYSIMPIILSK